jgi:hypothetical protein
MALVVRHDLGGEAGARGALRRAVREADPELALADLRSTRRHQHVRASLDGARLGHGRAGGLRRGRRCSSAATGV